MSGHLCSMMTRQGVLRALPGLVCVVLLGAVPAQAEAQANLNFVLKNRLGVTIREVYVSPHHVDNWEEDVLGNKTLADGRQIEITFSPEVAERGDLWDLKVVTSDGDVYSWTNPGFNLTEIYEITIYLSGGEATATWK